MIRKSVFSVLLPLLATSCWANGFYVGLGGGPDVANFDVNAHVTQIHAGRLSFNVQNDEELSGTGAFGTLFIGYGTRLPNFDHPLLNNLYLAGEFNGNLSSLEHENSNDEFVHMSFIHTQYRILHSFGVSVLPGYFFNDTTLFYARLGYVNGKLEVLTNDVSLANIHKNLDAFRWGLGIQEMLLPQWAMRVDYSHVSYNSASVSTLDVVSNTRKSTNFTPHTNEIEFSVIYSFV